MDRNDETTLIVDEALHDIGPILADIEALKNQLTELCDQFKWTLEAENKQADDRDKKLSHEERLDA